MFVMSDQEIAGTVAQIGALVVIFVLLYRYMFRHRRNKKP
jgi:hypothetical protein